MPNEQRSLHPIFRVLAGVLGPAGVFVSVLGIWDHAARVDAWLDGIAGVVFGVFLAYVAITGRNYHYRRGAS